MTDAFRWYRWLEAVNERPDIRPTTVRVAVQLARRADNKTGRSHPGEEWLMTTCCVSRRAVAYAIADLRRIGALVVLKPGTWRRRAQYELVAVENWATARTDVRTTDGAVARTNRHSQGAQIDTHRAHQRAHLTDKELPPHHPPLDYSPAAAASSSTGPQGNPLGEQQQQPVVVEEEKPSGNGHDRPSPPDDDGLSHRADVPVAPPAEIAAQLAEQRAQLKRTRVADRWRSTRPLDPTKAFGKEADRPGG